MHEIRFANVDDVPAMTGIYADAVENSVVTWDYEAPDSAQMRRRFDQKLASGYPILVAESANGTIAGYATGGPFHPQSGFRFTIENSIYVAGHCRRQGLGRKLLEALIEESTARGFRHMIAGISLPGGEASLAFHKALGFEQVGELPHVGWKHGKWLSALYLHRPLGDGSKTPPQE